MTSEMTCLGLACHTQEEISGRENVTKETVSQICQEMATLPESDKPACHTQEEIAGMENVDQKTVTNQISGILEELSEFLKSHPAASHLTDFDPPIYNIWKQQTKSEGANHFGNSEKCLPRTTPNNRNISSNIDGFQRCLVAARKK